MTRFQSETAIGKAIANRTPRRTARHTRGLFVTLRPMLIEVLKSKIHRVRVTEADLNYIGSITVDVALMEAANLVEGEKVQVVNINNGERLETYVIKGERGSGEICLNGPAARKVAVNDIVILISYAQVDFEEAKTFQPSVIFPDETTNQLRG